MTTLTATRTGRLLSTDGAQTTLGDHLAIHGPLSLAGDTEDASRSRFFEEIAASGLFGRGGAAFPTSRKWETMSRSRRRPVVVVNAMEGEPASSKDHVLLTRLPHLVLDGAEVAAHAVNASEIKICVAADNAVAATSMERAVVERRRSGLVRCPVTVHRPPGRYVAGEESALVSWLDKGRALPAFRPDKSVPLEVSRRPALVHNAETMSQIALIARNGAAWFRQRGTVEAPGSSLVTISGAVDAPGVFEVELGTPVSEMLGCAGVNAELSGRAPRRLRRSLARDVPTRRALHPRRPVRRRRDAGRRRRDRAPRNVVRALRDRSHRDIHGRAERRAVRSLCLRAAGTGLGSRTVGASATPSPTWSNGSGPGPTP